MKDVGLNLQNKGERDKVEIKDESTGWYRNPAWIQTGFVWLLLMGFIMLNWSRLSIELTNYITGITSFRLVDLFASFFLISLMLFAYVILVTIWTGGITNRLVYAKLFKKRSMWHLGEDNILHLYLPDTSRKGWWSVKGVGSFKVVKEAMFWLINGSLSMLTVYEHPEGINVNDIKDRSILKIDPKRFENRNTEARLEGIEAASNPLTNLNLAVLIPLVLIIGVAAYLIMGQMQTGQCQSELVALAKTCGNTAAETVKSTPSQNIISTIKGN